MHILPLEGVREDLKEALPQLQLSAIRDRMADLAGWQQQAKAAAEGAYAITGARIIDGQGGAPIDNAVMVVGGGRITAIGPRATTTIPGGLRTIDARGATIIPGLWDMHGHTSQIEWAPAYLAAGVTTVRDMGAEQPFITAFRDAVASGKGLGPRLLLAGLVDGAGEGGFGSTIAATPQEGRAVVDRYHAARFEQMKLYSLLGFSRAPAALAMNYRSVTNNTDAATAQGRVRDGQRMVKALFDAGVPIVAGTDGGLPGHSLLRSLELYVGAGLTPMQALLSATRVPAVAMGLAKDTGTLESGKRADFSVLDADPLQDISNVRRVRWVATNGRLLSPSGLWPLAGFRASGTMP
ncbi:MAG: hypothetical protein EXQ50_08860 [Acidobacteria bacterium]|nr:hypothetical protein [Acidobacteriota bacterium]